jgi:hypothetical protein
MIGLGADASLLSRMVRSLVAPWRATGGRTPGY